MLVFLQFLNAEGQEEMADKKKMNNLLSVVTALGTKSSNRHSKARLSDVTSRIRQMSKHNFSDGNDEQWNETKDPVKPADQLDLTPEELKKEYTRILRADNPYAPANIVRFNYVDREYKQGATVEQICMHFALDGGVVHIDSEEARRQKNRIELDSTTSTTPKKKATTAEAGTDTASGSDALAEAGTSSKTEEYNPLKVEAPVPDEDGAGEAKVDAKGLRNQFNFSERAQQTLNNTLKERAVNTDPPVRATFSANLTQWEIYELYQVEEARKQALKEKESKKKVEKVAEKRKTHQNYELGADEGGSMWSASAKLVELSVAEKLERMCDQNTYDDITLDFKYWEDASDEFKSPEGSLLPLYKFNSDLVKKRQVTALTWSPFYNDLFAVGYGSYDFSKQVGGHFCLFFAQEALVPDIAVQHGERYHVC